MFRIKNNSIKRNHSRESSLEVIQLNCNGISKKITELKIFLYTNKPDIMCLCETWLKIKEPRFIGYKAIWCHRVAAARGGLGILVREDISFKYKNLIPYPGGQLEWQCIEISTSQGPIEIMSIYNPNKDISVNEFYSYFSQLGHSAIAIGDFNAHSPTWDPRNRLNITGTSLETVTEIVDMSVLNDGIITYIDNRTGTASCLDLCVVSQNLRLVGSMERVGDIGSDHFPVKSTFGIKISKSNLKSSRKWKVAQADWSKYAERLTENKEMPPLDILPASAEEHNRILTSKIIDAANASIPRTTGEKKFNFSTPWWDKTCSEAVALRKSAKRKLWKCPSPENLINYKKHEAKARLIKNKKRKSSWQTFVTSLSSTTTTKTVWNKIKSIGGMHIPQNFPINGIPTSDDEAKSNAFLQHFTRQNDTVHADDADVEEVVDEISRLETFCSKPLQHHELVLAIRHLKNTAPGIDDVMNIFIKKLPDKYLYELLNLYNVSWATGQVPIDWKVGVVCPIPKPGKDPNQTNGYRPITMLSVIGKLMERIILRRMEYLLESRNLLHGAQFGFRKGKSTYNALSILSNTIRTAISEKKYCLVVYLDIEGAFDSLWPEGLLFKMKNLGFDQQILKWLHNYFTGRRMSVRIGNTQSEFKTLKKGVPQGAVLSPTLFNIMLCDLPESDGVSSIDYADDITLITSHTSLINARQHMQSHLDKLSAWCNKWRFNLNPNKCTFQIFTNKRTSPPINIRICNRAITLVTEQRVLGLLYDSPKLTFSNHIEYLKTECNKRVDIMRALSSSRWGSSRYLLRRVYTAFVRAKIEYGCVAFGDLSHKNMKKLEVVQNKALRAILGARKTSPVSSLEVEAYILPIEIRFKYIYLKWCLRLQYSPPNDYTIEMLNMETRNSSSFHMRMFNSLSNSCGHYSKRIITPAISPLPPEIDYMKNVYLNLPEVSCYSNSLFVAYTSDEFPGFKVIFTDGSKYADGSVSAGMYIPETEMAYSWKLNSAHTVVGSELIAIKMALTFANSTYNNDEPVLIVSDSKSALSIVANTTRQKYQYINSEIHKEILKREEGLIKFQWVRSHCGVFGNEMADRAANLGHGNRKSLLTSLSFEESVAQLQKSVLDYWVRKWKQRVQVTGTGSFLSNLIDTPKHYDAGKIPRILETSLSRLRIGHVGVGNHMHRFNMRQTPLCSRCGTPDTVEHFMLICLRHRRERDILRTQLADEGVDWNLRSILGLGNYSAKINKKVIKLLGRFLLLTGCAHQL